MRTSDRQKHIGRNIKKKKGMLTVDFKEHLLGELKDSKYAAGYLTAALEEGEDVFLLALRDVAQAHGGMAGLAQATKLNRENLYEMLSKTGNPRLSSITSILDKLGFQVNFKPKGKDTKAA
jgi:probable addiction module antidote protein